MSHTMVPGLKAAVDGKPITESHIWAWLVGVPVLGVVGDAALEAQLDGIIAGTPFLVAKHSVTRGTAKPAHQARGDSMIAIRDFAPAVRKHCAVPNVADTATTSRSLWHGSPAGRSC